MSGRHTDIINRGGAKIAPSEIEAALVQHPQVIEAAAFAIAHPTLGQDLAAAVVLRDTRQRERVAPLSSSRPRDVQDPGADHRRGAIAARILGQDRPQRAGCARRRERSSSSEPPIGREETEIARIFADVLKVPTVGRRDNFFDLGGDSLSATHVLAAVDAALGVSVGMEVLFDCPTVSEFAAAIARSARAGAAHPVSRVLGKIERRR